MPRLLRAVGAEFDHRFSRKDTVPINAYEGFHGPNNRTAPSLDGVGKRHQTDRIPAAQASHDTPPNLPKSVSNAPTKMRVPRFRFPYAPTPTPIAPDFRFS